MVVPAGTDWEWATRTGGTLSGEQRRKLTLALAREIPGLVATRIRRAAGRGPRGRLEFEGLRLPDSALARSAEEHARESLSVHLLEHSYRTYYFGRVLAELDRARYDDELVYVACLLHDLALEHPTPGRCFAVVGAERAVAFALADGAAAERADAVGAAIAAHITPGVAADLNDPGGFVSAGASVDVLGARIGDIDPTWLADLLVRHPRHGLGRHLRTAFGEEAKAVPRGRMALLLRAGFDQAVRLAPFSE
ncbi:HD domain-containing protein [Nocardia arizonensis]|uniref:HD domain-containing protein n=1 Tax=Nocardia arizonensis TaxID=1141647 RepID=UPI0006D1326C|nr:HD domain-containing protein [Nocardia arizonensis]